MWQTLFFSLRFNFYGLFIIFGLFLSYFYAKKRIKNFKINQKDFESLSIYLIPSSIIGSRIYHLLSWSSYYRLFPNEIFLFWKGGLGVFGALIFGFFTIIIFTKIKRVDTKTVLDFISPLVLLVQSVGRLGNYFNQEAFGSPTNLPWKFYVSPNKRPLLFLDNSYFHPTFLYESILCFLAFTLLILLEKKTKPFKGFSLGFYFLSYGLIRFLTEFWRFDTWQISNIKVAQLLSIFFVLGGIFILLPGIKSQKMLKFK